MIYAGDNQQGWPLQLIPRNFNFIDGKLVLPVAGRYFVNTLPVGGGFVTEFPRYDAAYVDFAPTAAHAGVASWRQTSVQERSFRGGESGQ